MTEKKLSPVPTLLSPGDTIEYGATIEINVGGGSVWLKMSTASTIREGETDTSAMNRISTFVESQLEKKAKEWMTS